MLKYMLFLTTHKQTLIVDKNNCNYYEMYFLYKVFIMLYTEDLVYPIVSGYC